MNKKIILSFFCFVFTFFLSAFSASASSQLYFTGSTNVEVGKTIRVQLRINTDGKKIGGISGNIIFSTELLEGLVPEIGGSLCNQWITNVSTKFECGVKGTEGFIGDGLIYTLVFRGRNSGTTNITISNFQAFFGPLGESVNEFSSGSYQIDIYGKGQTPIPALTPNPTPTLTPTPLPTLTPTFPSTTGDTYGDSIDSSGDNSYGFEPLVPGQTGTIPEDPIKSSDPIDISFAEGVDKNQASIKNFFTENQRVLIGFFPTLLLLMLVFHLGVKLYFTKKRRYLEIERLFENQLGTLSALEGKLDLLDQKGGQGKEKFLNEFAEAKNHLLSDVNPNYFSSNSNL